MVFSFFRVITNFIFRPPQRLAALYHRIEWKQFEAMLCYRIRSKDYFVHALIHRSFLSTDTASEYQSNERLEFLGDAVLDFVVGEYLYEQFPQKEEGELTVLRSKLVNRKALVYFGKMIDLRRFILTNTTANGVAEKGYDTIIADAYEAIIAALYLDGGINEAKKFILRQLIPAVATGFLSETDKNYKSELLELAQAMGKGIPRYATVKEVGPDHDRTFTIEVFVGNESHGTGSGKNKKEAEQNAAQGAVEKLQQEFNA